MRAWSQLDLPTKIGIATALTAMALSLLGIARNPEIDFNVRTFFVATVIAGSTWGFIAWGIAVAIMDIEEEEPNEHDVA
ncbi:MAG: hypothetical protein D6802_09370 [Ardenticatenia bacterium]|nr:MAG: hypothetical protein D6802_09370 [Ardenticatenia bacterium]